MIVFASKKVGYECLRYLLSIEEKIDCVVIPAKDEVEIIKLCKQIPILEFENFKKSEWIRREYNWLLNLWSPSILNNEILSVAKHRMNLHPSYVPYCRGNDNAAWTIRNGDLAGVSLLEMTNEVDGADYYVRKKVPYSYSMSGKELHFLLQDKIIELFIHNWKKIKEKPIAYKQENGGSYHIRKHTNMDRTKQIDETLSVGEFVSWALAHNFYPGTTAEIKKDKRKYKVILRLEEIYE